jgi:uncharacterized membrane protein YbaN (DUF454 family)
MKKSLFIAAGFLSLALGLAGIVLPILPTTPFLLLSAACFFRGSERMYNWLMNHKLLGEHIRNFREHQAIPRATKISSIVLLWVTILFSIFFVVDKLALRLLLGAIAAGVTLHILHYKTLKK